MVTADPKVARVSNCPPGRRAVRVCIVRPPTLTSIGAVGHADVPPIGPAYITGSLQAAGHHVTVVDAVGAALDQYTRLRGYERVLVHGLTEEQIVDRIPRDTEAIGIS